MVNKQKFLAIVRQQKGYMEKASNANLDDPVANAGHNNWTKYAALLDSIPDFYNGQKNGPWGEWCDMFYDGCMAMAYGPELAKKLLCQPDRSAGAGCEYSAQYYKSAGRWFQTPETADQIFFDYGSGISHTGAVIMVVGNTVHTIEGNSNDMVMEHMYSLDNPCIAGYGRPCWELYSEDEAEDPGPEEDVWETCSVQLELPILKMGDLSWHVALMQLILYGRGFSCGSAGADGDFGPATDSALRTYQSANGLEPDGICESKTWEKLLT